jgi:hypothetical protein
MKNRAVFSTASMEAAKAAMSAARSAGVKDSNLSLIARSDISLEKIPDDYKEVNNDFYPAAIKGAAGGGAIGLLAGIIAAAIPPIGLTLAGACLMTLGGVSLGAWSTALAGSAIADPVRRKFEKEIEDGRILVVVDADEPTMEIVKRAVVETGAVPMPFDTPTVMT